MRKLIVATLLLILGTSATAMADRGRDRDSRRGDRRGYVQHDHRNNYTRPVVTRDRQVRRSYDYRRPIYVNNGRYTFHNGRTFNYRRPVIQYRYTNYRTRPTLLVENYDTVPGYIWTAGSWQWNGYEWNWIAGHYDADTSYNHNNYSNYDNINYDNINYDDTRYDTGYTNPVTYPVSNGHDCD